MHCDMKELTNAILVSKAILTGSKNFHTNPADYLFIFSYYPGMSYLNLLISVIFHLQICFIKMDLNGQFHFFLLCFVFHDLIDRNQIASKQPRISNNSRRPFLDSAFVQQVQFSSIVPRKQFGSIRNFCNAHLITFFED